MKYHVEFESCIYVTVEVEAGSLDEAIGKVRPSLPRYEAAVGAVELSPADPGTITVSDDWDLRYVRCDVGEERAGSEQTA